MRMGWETFSDISGHDAGRLLLARLYREETGSALPEILVTPQGKPYFSDEKLHFSISHTATHVFCCLCDKNVGLDAEPVTRALSADFAQRFLSETERARFSAAKEAPEVLLRFFVLKESYAKLSGRGWGNYLKGTDFDPFCENISVIDGHFVAILTQEETSHAL